MARIQCGLLIGVALLAGCSESVGLGGTGTTGTTSGTTTGGSSSTGGLLAPGAPCTGNRQCLSDVCGLDGGGNCCTAACAATTDPACHATACDTSGLCVYSSGASCGATCSNGVLASGTCDATGTCGTLVQQACPGNLSCESGTACRVSCGQSSDCATGFYCDADAGSCALTLATGACTANALCTSGVCGVSGTGHCCTAACDVTDPACGATDCDGTGACSYPSSTTACGDGGGPSCKAGGQTNPSLCDGAGTCLGTTTDDCAPFTCGAKACLTTCAVSTDCVGGDVCDTGACCAAIATNGTLAVDSVTGSDATPCCGYGSAGPCQTLTHAMALIDSASAKNVTINATVNGGGGDWGLEPAYPVRLGWGIELNAPGVNFLDTNQVGDSAILQITFVSNRDTVGYASLVGTAASPIAVGMDSKLTVQTQAATVITVDPNNTLYLANAVVNSHADFFFAIGILVGPNASLIVGQDKSAATTGTVSIGNALGLHATNGAVGIYCESDGVSSGCTIQDAALVGVPSLVVQGQESADIVVQSFGNATLGSNPVFGVPPSAPGFGNCGVKLDGISSNGAAAVLVQGPSTVFLSNATIQCVAGFGVQVNWDTGNPGFSPPNVLLDKTTIQNTDVGIGVSGGTVTLTSSTIQFNNVGILQTDDASGLGPGMVDLSGGGNSVVCSSNVESSTSATQPGIDIYNTGSRLLDADNTAFDTPGPDYFDCDSLFSGCVCDNASCSVSPNADGMSVVEDATIKGGVSLKSSTISTISCK